MVHVHTVSQTCLSRVRNSAQPASRPVCGLGTADNLHKSIPIWSKWCVRAYPLPNEQIGMCSFILCINTLMDAACLYTIVY